MTMVCKLRSWGTRQNYSTLGSDLNFKPLAMSNQFVHGRMQVNSIDFECDFIVVYGLHTIQDRTSMWSGLKNLSDTFQLSWVIIGDFKTILEVDDRVGSLVQDTEIRDFSNFFQDMDISELKSVGRTYTWTNSHVHSKLDKAIVNAEWVQKFNHLEAEVMDPGCLDHSPIAIMLDEKRSTER
ncbi:hypothetical protein FXO38_24306 [Capsicum annuum]|uniref:Endonuclease/exonuclease/phosphatase domain-containing protein n=1 Tax=Capsicum annuum TaxID=4072 RepID=A0A2G2Y8L6_CAPAN|nr:hypothetical protein FXO38_24306 [Capsicum annuum]KAF3674009.1 hypothetical protein FXO37_06638 [Capsicum annuum]PHT66088.1 hypothetical protein T459_30513 [Capsicum annuum]